MDFSTLGMWANDVLTKPPSFLPQLHRQHSPGASILDPAVEHQLHHPEPAGAGRLRHIGHHRRGIRLDLDSTIHYPDGGSGGLRRKSPATAPRARCTRIRSSRLPPATNSICRPGSSRRAPSPARGHPSSSDWCRSLEHRSSPLFHSHPASLTSESWAQLAGAGSYAPWTVPAGITSVRPYLQVGSGRRPARSTSTRSA